MSRLAFSDIPALTRHFITSPLLGLPFAESQTRITMDASSEIEATSGAIVFIQVKATQRIPSESSVIQPGIRAKVAASGSPSWKRIHRSEEHTSELQSRENLVCRLLLAKKKSIH